MTKLLQRSINEVFRRGKSGYFRSRSARSIAIRMKRWQGLSPTSAAARASSDNRRGFRRIAFVFGRAPRVEAVAAACLAIV